MDGSLTLLLLRVVALRKMDKTRQEEEDKKREDQRLGTAARLRRLYCAKSSLYGSWWRSAETLNDMFRTLYDVSVLSAFRVWARLPLPSPGALLECGLGPERKFTSDGVGKPVKQATFFALAL